MSDTDLQRLFYAAFKVADDLGDALDKAVKKRKELQEAFDQLSYIVSPSDESTPEVLSGMLNIAIDADHNVVVDLGKPRRWFALSADDARNLAKALLQNLGDGGA